MISFIHRVLVRPSYAINDSGWRTRLTFNSLVISLFWLTMASEVPACTWTVPPIVQNFPLQDADSIFTDLEPGVRLLGKPSPTAALGQVLDFLPLPDETRIVTVCTDGLKLWDVDHGEIIKSLPFEQPITTCSALQFSNDKQSLAVSTRSQTNPDSNQPGRVMIVDLELKRRTELVIDDQHEDSDAYGLDHVTALAFSPDDSSIALATGRAVLLFDVDSADLIESIDLGIEPAFPTRLLFERDRILAFGSKSRLIDLQNGTVSDLPRSHVALNGCIQSCIDEPSNKMFGLFFKGPDKLRAIRLSDGASEGIEFGDEKSAPFMLALSPDGSLVAVCHFDTPNSKPKAGRTMNISVIDTKDLELKYRFANLPLRPGQVKFTGANDGLLVAFNMEAGFQYLIFDPQQVEQKPNYQHNRPLRTVLLSADGSHFVGSFLNTQTSSWDWATGQETQVDCCNSIFPTASTDNYFAMAQQGMNISLVRHTFGKNSPKEIRSFPMRQPIAGPLAGYLFGFTERPKVEAYFVLPTAVNINASQTELHCVVLDMLDGIRIQSFEIPGYGRTRDELFERPSNSMMNTKTAIANDGKRFAVVESGKLKVIDVESKETIFEQPGNNITQLFFSKTQDWLAISTKRGVTILDPETGVELEKIDAPEPKIAYAFGSNKLLIASAKAGSKVCIFDTETWDVAFEHSTKTANRVSVAISSDGRRVAFALDNCRLELWDVDKLN